LPLFPLHGSDTNFPEYDDQGNPDTSTIKPMIDGGTEGFKGHARVLIPGVTPCFECTLWLFPPQTKFPLCTLAETPRSPHHCIEYAKIILWPRERPEEDFDPDVEDHMKWIYDKAVARAKTFGIQVGNFLVSSLFSFLSFFFDRIINNMQG
jgi:NEDD8-activating enzyme E1